MASDLPPLPAPQPLARAVAKATPTPLLTAAPGDVWGSEPPRLDWRLGLAPALRGALDALARRAAAIAAAAPGEPHKAIHAQRRTLRRARALLRLVGPALAPQQAKAWMARLGEASRQLGVYRDAEVLPAAVQLLRGAEPAALAALHHQLSAARELARNDPEALHQLQRTAQGLATLAAEAQSATLDLSPATLSRSLGHAVQRARDLAKLARKRPRPEAVHELRKRAKDLRHQLEWLGVRRDQQALGSLIAWLGDLGEFADLLALHAWIKGHGEQQAAADHAALLQALRASKAKRARRCLRDAEDALPRKGKRRARALVLAALQQGADADGVQPIDATLQD